MADVMLLAVDSWGGVAPMITLAGALRAAGISARIAASTDFGDQVRAAGCEFVDLQMSVAAWWAEQNAAHPGWPRSPRKTLTVLRSSGAAQARDAARLLADLVQPGEAIMSGVLSLGSATGVAELRHSRVIAFYPAPLTASHLPGGSLAPVLSRSSRLNEWSGRLAERGAGWMLRPAVNVARQALRLPSWTTRAYLAAVRRLPTVYGVSPALMPPDPEWPARITVTGHLLRSDPDPVIPEGLADFLDRHPGAVYVGFGSWGSAVSPADLELVGQALAQAERPGVIASPGQRGVLPGTSTPVFAVGEVSHDWLFPRVAAVVHHGGSGTTHRGVLAGVPGLAVPIGFDQPYWGRRLADLGVGASPVPYRKLTAPRLAAAIRQLTDDPRFSARARQLSTVLRAEDGPAVAATAVKAALAD